MIEGLTYFSNNLMSDALLMAGLVRFFASNFMISFSIDSSMRQFVWNDFSKMVLDNCNTLIAHIESHGTV